MLIVRASPAGLRQARNFPPRLAASRSLVRRQSKLAVHAARNVRLWNSGLRWPARRRIARLLLQFDLRLFALLRPGLRIADQLFELGAPGGRISFANLEAALLAHEHVGFGPWRTLFTERKVEGFEQARVHACRPRPTWKW